MVRKATSVQTWPQLRLSISSNCRYRMKLFNLYPVNRLELLVCAALICSCTSIPAPRYFYSESVMRQIKLAVCTSTDPDCAKFYNYYPNDRGFSLYTYDIGSCLNAIQALSKSVVLSELYDDGTLHCRGSFAVPGTRVTLVERTLDRFGNLKKEKSTESGQEAICLYDVYIQFRGIKSGETSTLTLGNAVKLRARDTRRRICPARLKPQIKYARRHRQGRFGSR